MRFEELATTRKGDIGERIVKSYLTKREMTIYSTDSGPHPIDFVAIDQAGKLFFVEVKTYPRRAKKSDTGIDLADWYKYAEIERIGVVWLFFIDEFEGCCYVCSLSDLKRNNTTQGEKIYFDLSLFKVLFWLDRGDLNEIRKASKVNMEQYKGTKRHFR